MTVYHQLRASGRWFKFSLMEQMANIGSDVDRAIRWKKEGKVEYSNNAFERVMAMVDLTIEDPKNKGRLKEVLLFKETFTDYLLLDNSYSFTEQFWQDYFYFFSYAAIAEREKKKKNLSK